MLSYTQTFFLGQRILSPASRATIEYTCAQPHPPRSFAFCCPHCGEVWARRAILPETRWFFWTIPCRNCAPVNNNHLAIPGSLWLSAEPDYLASLPLEVLKYEAELYCKLGPIKH